MTEEKLKEIMDRLRYHVEDVRGDDMVEYYAIENVIREVCGLYGGE